MDMTHKVLAGEDIRPLAATRAPVRSARPLIAIVGSSGSGKTTLIEALIPELLARGIRVAVIKHAHRGLDLDKPGKDTHRASAAGAAQVVVASGSQWAVMGRVEHPGTEPSLEWLITRLDLESVDLILAEGFHFERCPKLEVHRPLHGRAPLCANDPGLIALATDAPFDGPGVLDLNDTTAIAELIVARVAGPSVLAAAV